MDEENKQLILDFVKSCKLAVLSTVTPDGKSESAVLEFGQTDDLELIFDCFETSRKYKNLEANKNISMVIGWDDNITVQYEGMAKEVFDEEKKKYQKLYWSKNPKAERWAGREGIRYYKIIPKWIRYSDLNRNPWKIIELEF